MKKLANLIALFILVSVNVFTPITYAQEVLDVLDKYNCTPKRGEYEQYYLCESAQEGQYSCRSDGEKGYVCGYDETEETIYGCNLEDDSYYCPIDYYNMNGSTEEGLYFEPSWGEGEYYCERRGEGVSSLSMSDLRNTSSYGEFMCYTNGKNYYGCDVSLDGEVFCPWGYDVYPDIDNGTYNFYKSEDNGYICEYSHEDESIVEDYGDDYICGVPGHWMACHEDYISLPGSEPKFLEDDYDLGYVCPIHYSCYEEEGTIYCQEEMSGQYKCKSNLSVGEKGLLDDMGEYSCSNSVNIYSCDWNEDEWKFECGEPSIIKYSCEFDGKDGYKCTEYEEGSYKCGDFDSLPAPSSIYDNFVCYDGSNGIYHRDCSPIDDNEGYFCPVKWGTTFDNDGEYECLAEGAEYDDELLEYNGRYEAEYNEELGQCVYRVPGYDGEDIIIMSSNLGVTQYNPIGLYYQWGTGHGYQPSVSDMIPDSNKDSPLYDDELDLFTGYDLEALGDTWSDEADPCPTGFHVPSMKEWNNLFISWCENDEECEEYVGDLKRSDYPENQWALNDPEWYNNVGNPEWHGEYEEVVNRFMEDYGLGLFGSHDGYTINMFGLMGDYWSSERMLGDADASYHDIHNRDKSSWGLTLYPEGGVGPLGFYSHMAASVRCFADVEDDVEVSTPVALDLYIGGCAQGGSIAPTSAIEVLEDSVLCENDGYRGRNFVASGETVDLDELEDSFLPAGYNWVWYLDDDQTTKLTENTFTHDTVLYAFEEITPITLIITKVRNDADNQDGIRPGSVTVKLYEDNGLSPVVSNTNLITTVILSGGNGWTATVPNLLPSHNIDYIWEEDAVSGYESSQNTNGFITTLTNTHTPAVVTKYTVTFNSNGGSAINPVEVVEGQPVNRPNPNPTRNGYTFDGWTLNGEAFDFSASITGNITLKAEWEILHYTITYEDEGTQIPGLEPSSYTIEDSFTLPTLPAKTGYKFDGWSDNGTKITKIQAGNTGNKTLVAIRTEDKPSGGNSGGYSGGGGGSPSKGGGGNKPDVESVENEPSTPAKEESKPDPKPVVPGKGANNTGKANPNQELFDAYEWAYANGLTKYGNMSDARMNDILNRQEMAKITTIFASKFKNNTPNEDKRDFCSQYPDLWKTTKDMQEYIIQSCELGYMGYRANGIDALDRFRPYTPVSVAEVSIILSRIMWQNKYAINENLWYQGHLHAVYENNLLDNITKPFDYIIRKDAYIMLYRISKTL